MTNTRAADILDALYDVLAGTTYIAQEITAERLRLFDGPLIGDDSSPSILTVGTFIALEKAPVSSEWDWGSMGRSGQFADIDEWVRIPCGIASVDGDSETEGGVASMRALRRVAINIYAAAAEAIRSSTLGLDVVQWCIPGPAQITPQYTEDGTECVIDFTANIRTRI